MCCRLVLVSVVLLLVGLTSSIPLARASESQDNLTSKPLRAGIIGLDTSHVVAFTQLLNAPNPKPELAGVRVVAAYPGGSPDIPSSRDRVAGFTQELRDKFGVAIVGSIDELLAKVDVVLLESVDGRPHLEQARPVFKAHKPVFIDKPVAGSLADAIAIFELARETNTPCFSSSSLRFSPGIAAIRNNAKVGDVLGCDVYGPCSLEEHHPDLFWYGIHGVEALFTIMGTGCQSVSRTQTEGTELVVGRLERRPGRDVPRHAQGPSKYGGDRLRHQGDRPERRLRRLRAVGRRDRQVLQDRQAARECRGDDRDLRLHGSRRREQAPGGQAGDARERDGQGQGPARQVAAGLADALRPTFQDRSTVRMPRSLSLR